MSAPKAPISSTEVRKVSDIFDDPEPRYMVKKAIEAVKAAVSVEQVAAEYAELKRAGAGRLEGRCIAPDHEDAGPSMSVYEDHVHCYGCGLHGDAIDVERIAGRHMEMWTAVIALSERYGVELPRRPQRWHEWSLEKGRRFEEIRKVRTQIYQRRLFRFFRDQLAEIEDPEEREAEAREVYVNLYSVARSCAIAREGAARG